MARMVRVIRDVSSYTGGIYQGRVGRVEITRLVPLANRPPMPLCFVRVEIDELPSDQYGLGGWWYHPSELTLLR